MPAYGIADQHARVMHAANDRQRGVRKSGKQHQHQSCALTANIEEPPHGALKVSRAHQSGVDARQEFPCSS